MDLYATNNPIGYKIEKDDISSILNASESDPIRRHVECFFKNYPLSQELLLRYAEACENMTNISIGPYQQDLNEKLIEPLASAKRSYSYDEPLACIELCALNSEMICNFLIIINQNNLSDSSVLEKMTADEAERIKKHLRCQNFFDEMNQKIRIKWLLNGNIIDSKDNDDLSDIHETRKNYFHHWNHAHTNINSDALKCLNLISRIISNHLELLDNSNNISIIQNYLANI